MVNMDRNDRCSCSCCQIGTDHGLVEKVRQNILRENVIKNKYETLAQDAPLRRSTTPVTVTTDV